MPKLAMALPRRMWLSAGGVLLLPALCLATDVRVVAVTPGRSADLAIEHGAPITVEVGETVEGVTLLRVDRSGAVVSVAGITKTLPLVADTAPAADAGTSGTTTLSADARGHFFTNGAVNGRPVRFLIDTGATLTTLSRTDAQRIGLAYRGGTPTAVRTVNGVARGWRVSLDSVRIGEMTVRNVDAVVIDNDALAVGLLGLSFLDHFDMQRRGSTLVLRRRR